MRSREGLFKMEEMTACSCEEGMFRGMQGREQCLGEEMRVDGIS